MPFYEVIATETPNAFPIGLLVSHIAYKGRQAGEEWYTCRTYKREADGSVTKGPGKVYMEGDFLCSPVATPTIINYR